MANKYNHLVSADNLSLDPTLHNTASNPVVYNDDDVTIITSNRPPCKQINATRVHEWPSIASTARMMFGNPMLQYLNTLTIAANKTVVDTGVTEIFIMDNTELNNKHVTTKPLKINLPNGTTIWSTHVCNIIIPGLP